MFGCLFVGLVLFGFAWFYVVLCGLFYFDFVCYSFGLVRLGLVWFDLVYFVRFVLVWFCCIWTSFVYFFVKWLSGSYFVPAVKNCLHLAPRKVEDWWSCFFLSKSENV